MINLACIFFSFESEWESYRKGSESLIWLEFSSNFKVNGKPMQKVLNS